MKPSIKLITATIAALLICQVLYIICSTGLRKYNIHKTDRLSEIFLNNTAFDIIFIGSSRTHTTINPAIIDSICSASTYNAGVDGGNLYEFKLTLDGYLINHPPPEYLILTLDISSFDLKRKFFNYTQYFPYVRNDIVKEKLKENGHNTAIFQIFPFLQFTAYDDYTRGNILKGLIGRNEIPEGDFQYKGYLSNTANQIKDSLSKPIISTRKAELTQEGLDILHAIIGTCKANKTKVIFTYAPEYRSQIQNAYSNKEAFFKTISDISKVNKIDFLRHDRLNMCQDPKLFTNAGHVNKLGADVYTRLLAKQLDSMIR